ncbi:hypothetical protein LP417_13635 [Polaromonas sp. P1-6]|nr:hypothetical protein LP417_13635 [Polaromonas sp. P1-6]
MQIPLHTQSSAEAYIAGHEWRDACLLACPMHPLGGCSFARHGSYARVTPQGLHIARWYCPQGHRTFSLLPDFLASRLPGLLTSIEAAAVEAKLAASMEAAADTLRGFEVTLPSALRWLRRRVRAVQAALEAVSRLGPQTLGRALASGPTLWIELGQGYALLDLRRSLAPHLLHRLPAPLGFLPSRAAARSRDGNQHDMGPDAERDIRYGVTADVRRPPCNVIPPILCHQLPFRRPADMLRVWRADRCVQCSCASWYLQWVERYRAYCTQRGLDERAELTLDGARRFIAWYARRRHLDTAHLRGARSALIALSRVYQVMGLNLPTWQAPARVKPSASALLRAFADHLARHRGNPEATVHKKLDHVGKLLGHLARQGKTWRTMTLHDIDEFLVEFSHHYAFDDG